MNDELDSQYRPKACLVFCIFNSRLSMAHDLGGASSSVVK